MESTTCETDHSRRDVDQNGPFFPQETTYLKGISPDTIRYYDCVRRTLATILSEPTKAGMLACVQKPLADGVSPISVNSYLPGFRAYVNWLHQEGHLKELFKVQLLKTQHTVVATLNTDQVNRILRCSPKGVNERRIHTFCVLLLDTGLRLSEVLSLTRDAIYGF
jgi:site-specific recombinase XerD